MTVPAEGGGDHQALLYEDPASFERTVTAFLRDGLDAGDRVVAFLRPDKLERVRTALGAAAGQVELADAGALFRRQGRALRAVFDYLSEATAAGRRARLVAEQDLARRGPAEVAYYLRLEAAANVIFGRLPVSVLCPYDAVALPERALDGCESCHPRLVGGGGTRPSERFVRPERYLAESATRTAPPSQAATFACDRPEDLGAARAFVRHQAVRAGLRGSAVAELVIGADEVLANALVHGRAPRHLWMYTEGSHLVCHVHDSGPGFADPVQMYLPPTQRAAGGVGLWIAHQTADALEMGTDRTGTHVRLLTTLRQERDVDASAA